MNRNTPLICVAGNGPNAFLATSMLLQRGSKVVLIDSNEDFSTNKNILNKLILKNRDEKKSLYLQGIPIMHDKKSNTSPIETRASGGLTNFWGGVFFPPYLPLYTREHNIVQEDFDEITGFFSRYCTYENESTQVWNQVVGKMLDESSVGILELLPQIMKSRDGSIWNSNQLWKVLRHENLEIRKGTLLKFQPGDRISLNVRINDNQQVIYCDQLFLACGPIGNAKIIANSMSDGSRVELADSGVTYWLTFSFRKPKHFHQIMHAQKCGFVFKNHDVEGYYQHYPFSVELINSLKYPFLRTLITVLNRFFGQRFGLLMIFQNDVDSRSILVSKEADNLILSRQGRHKVWIAAKIYIKLLKVFRESGIVLTPLFFIGNAGEGAHSAGPELEKLRNANPNELIPQEIGNRIHLLGMSSTNRVLAGPITHLSLVLTRSIIRRAYSGD